MKFNNFVFVYSFVSFCLVLYFLTIGGHKTDTKYKISF